MGYPFLTAAAVWAVWNLITFGMMGIDKYKAEHGKWRVSEKALLLSAFLMGAVGSLAGSRIFHHKTKKLKFRICLPLALAVNAAAAVFFLYSLPAS